MQEPAARQEGQAFQRHNLYCFYRSEWLDAYDRRIGPHVDDNCSGRWWKRAEGYDDGRERRSRRYGCT